MRAISKDEYLKAKEKYKYYKSIISAYEKQENFIGDFGYESKNRVDAIIDALDQLDNDYEFRIESRKRHIVTFRQYVQYWLRRNTTFSLYRIGKLTGGKDHSTVIYACKVIDYQMEMKEKNRCLDITRASLIIETRMQHLARQ